MITMYSRKFLFWTAVLAFSAGIILGAKLTTNRREILVRSDQPIELNVNYKQPSGRKKIPLNDKDRAFLLNWLARAPNHPRAPEVRQMLIHNEL
jgi:hypothetical protein